MSQTGFPQFEPFFTQGALITIEGGMNIFVILKYWKEKFVSHKVHQKMSTTILLAYNSTSQHQYLIESFILEKQHNITFLRERERLEY